MPSLKCSHCYKIKRCKLHRDGGNGMIVYLCRPCERELGYRDEGGEA